MKWSQKGESASRKTCKFNLCIEYLDFPEFIKCSINIIINATGHTCISILTMLLNNYYYYYHNGDNAVHTLFV